MKVICLATLLEVYIIKRDDKKNRYPWCATHTDPKVLKNVHLISAILLVWPEWVFCCSHWRWSVLRLFHFSLLLSKLQQIIKIKTQRRVAQKVIQSLAKYNFTKTEFLILQCEKTQSWTHREHIKLEYIFIVSLMLLLAWLSAVGSSSFFLSKTYGAQNDNNRQCDT